MSYLTSAPSPLAPSTNECLVSLGFSGPALAALLRSPSMPLEDGIAALAAAGRSQVPGVPRAKIPKSALVTQFLLLCRSQKRWTRDPRWRASPKLLAAMMKGPARLPKRVQLAPPPLPVVAPTLAGTHVSLQRNKAEKPTIPPAQTALLAAQKQIASLKKENRELKAANTRLQSALARREPLSPVFFHSPNGWTERPFFPESIDTVDWKAYFAKSANISLRASLRQAEVSLCRAHARDRKTSVELLIAKSAAPLAPNSPPAQSEPAPPPVSTVNTIVPLGAVVGLTLPSRPNACPWSPVPNSGSEIKITHTGLVTDFRVRLLGGSGEFLAWRFQGAGPLTCTASGSINLERAHAFSVATFFFREKYWPKVKENTSGS